MKRVILFTISLLALATAFSQTNSIGAKNVIAYERMILRGRTVDSLTIDTNLNVVSHFMVASALAVKTYVDNRIAAGGGGGGGGGDITNAANVGSSGVGVFAAKSGANLNFRNINSTSAGTIAISLTGNNIDVTPDADLIAIAGLSPVNDNVLQYKAGSWTNRTPSQLKSDLVLIKNDVGLGNVDNTSDLSKPISTATQAALDGKQALDADLTAIAGLSPTVNDMLQYRAGAWTNRTPAQIKTDLALVKADVGLGSVVNVDQTNATNITSGTLADARLTSNVALKNITNNFIAIQTYNADLSGSYTARTLVDKGYVDGKDVTLQNQGTITDGDSVMVAIDAVTLGFKRFKALNAVFSVTNNANSLIFGLADRNDGDITVSGTSITVNARAVTAAKLFAASAPNKLLGRYSAGSGDFQEITISTGLALDGSGNLTASGGGGGITGSLTSGRVPYATGASTVADNGNFTWVNASNYLRVDGQISIGAAPPANIPFYAKITDNTGAPPPIARYENLGTGAAYVEWKSDARTWAPFVYGSGGVHPGNFAWLTNGTNVYEMDFVGNIAVGGASLSSPARLNVLSSFAGQTANNKIVYFTNTGATFDATAASRTSYGTYTESISSRSAGTNNVINVGLYSAASNGQINYAAILAGTTGINTTTPRQMLDVLATGGPQIRSTYTDNSVYTDFQTLSSGVHQVTYTGDRLEVKSGSTNRYAGVGGLIRAFFADASTSGSSAQALYSWSMEANVLAATGQSVQFKYHATFGGITQIKQLGFSFAGNNILSSPLPATATGEYDVFGIITRTGSGTARVTWYVSGDRDGSQNGFVYSHTDDLSSITFSGTNTLSFWVLPGSSEGITAKTGYIWWWPQYGTGAD